MASFHRLYICTYHIILNAFVETDFIHLRICYLLKTGYYEKFCDLSKNMSYYYNAKFLLLKTFWIIFHNSIYKNWKISFYTFTLFCFFFHYFRLYIIYNFWDIFACRIPLYCNNHKIKQQQYTLAL